MADHPGVADAAGAGPDGRGGGGARARHLPRRAGYCERLASHDTALRAAGTARAAALSPAGGRDLPRPRCGCTAGNWWRGSGPIVDELSDVLVRAVVPIAVAAVLSVAAVAVIAVISPAAAAVLAVCLVIAGVVAPVVGGPRRDSSRSRCRRSIIPHRDVAAMLALEHAPELRVSGRLDEVIAEAERAATATGDAPSTAPPRLPRWPRRRRPPPSGSACSAPSIAGIGLSAAVAPTTAGDTDAVAAVGVRSHRGATRRRCRS